MALISCWWKWAARWATLKACRSSKRSASSVRKTPRGSCIYIHLTLLPWIPTAGELKTKPTQHSVKELRSIGIQPDILLCRADREIPVNERRKIALFCNVRPSAVIQALDVANIYDVPRAYHAEGLDQEVLDAFGITDAPQPDLSRWNDIMHRIIHPEGEVTIAVVGKYTGLLDAYKSLKEALVHGGIANRVKVNLEWIESEVFEKEDPAPYLEGVARHSRARRLWRARLGRQDPRRHLGPHPQDSLLRHLFRHADGLHRSGTQSLWHQGCQLHRVRRNGAASCRHHEGMDEGQRAGNPQGGRRSRRHHAARRFRCEPAKDSHIAEIYGTTHISERHRHRYEVNTAYRKRLGGCGLEFSPACRPTGCLPETVEYTDHPWFIGVQYHPELKSKPFEPHPLFSSFIAAAVVQSRLV